MTPVEQILNILLENVQKLLVDPRTGKDVTAPGYDDTPYQESQFKNLYGDVAYDANLQRYPFLGETGGPPFYPLTQNETLDLQESRVLEYVQLGFSPIRDLELDSLATPSLYLANATDRRRIQPGNVTLTQVEEVIPLNFRLILKQPADYTRAQTNIIMLERVLEGLKYVLNPGHFINLTFQRRGYNAPTVVRALDFVQAVSLEEFLSPYEVVDFLFQITVREQRTPSVTP